MDVLVEGLIDEDGPVAALDALALSDADPVTRLELDRLVVVEAEAEALDESVGGGGGGGGNASSVLDGPVAVAETEKKLLPEFDKPVAVVEMDPVSVFD